jgi:hypothetical protein
MFRHRRKLAGNPSTARSPNMHRRTEDMRIRAGYGGYEFARRVSVAWVSEAFWQLPFL